MISWFKSLFKKPENRKPITLNDYFSHAELACKGNKCGCGNSVILDPVFEKELLKLRLLFNRPMNVNSCCRCKVHNTKVGGAVKSFHLSDKPAWEGIDGTAAIDISYNDIETKVISTGFAEINNKHIYSASIKLPANAYGIRAFRPFLNNKGDYVRIIFRMEAGSKSYEKQLKVIIEP